MCAGSKRESHSQVEGLARRLALIALAAAQLLSAATLAQSDSAAPAGSTCAHRQLIVVELQRSWRCTVMLKADDAFVVHVDQRDVDVIVTLEDEGGHEVLAVDSPAKRASAEVLLAGPRLSGKHTLLVRTKPGVTSAQRASLMLVLERLDNPSALLAGLAEMTRAAALDDRQTPESAKDRILQLQTALAKLQAVDAQEWQAEVSLRIAATYLWVVNDYPAAASSARLAMDAFSKIGDSVGKAQASIIHAAAAMEIATAGKVPRARGRADVAQSPLGQAVDLLDSQALVLREAGLRYAQAQALNFAGVGLFYQSDYSAARSRYEQAAAIFRSLDDRTSAALPLQNIAHIDYDSGDYATAITSFRSALDVLDPTANARQYVAVLINLATAQYVMGHFEGALRSLTTALDICEERGFPTEQARSLHNLGMVYLVIGDRDRAQVFLERALELRRPLASQDPRGLQTSLIRVGDLRRERDDVRGALSLHGQALEAAVSPWQKARALYAIGRDHEQNGALEAAAQAYKRALDFDVPQDFPVRVALLGAYGAVQLRNGDDTGRALVERAAQLHEAQGDLDKAAENYLVLAQADRRHQQVPSALRNVQKALALHESQGVRAMNPDLRATYLANRAEAAELLGELYMTQWDRSGSAREKERLANATLLTVEAGRQRALEDFRSLADGTVGQAVSEAAALDAQLSAKRHRLATLLDQQNPPVDTIAALRSEISLLRTQIDIAQPKQPDGRLKSDARRLPASVAEIQKTLQPRETVLLYQLGSRQSRLWAVTREAISVTALGGRARLEDAARELYQMWSTPVAVDAQRELAASRIILGDDTSWLYAGDRIVVVTDGILRSLPFGALPVASSDGALRRIAATNEVSFRPTLHSAENSVRTDAAATPGNRILLVGDPTAPKRRVSAASAGVVDPWALPPLPGSRREIQDIAAITADWRSYVLLGAEATKPALLSMPLDSFRTIHFATHARLDIQDPQLSSIALSSREESSSAASSMLTVREIVGFRLNAEMVVLSACEASLGKSYRGQLSFGLSEAFLLAGAQTVLGSLWKVSDDAAHSYMQRFYEAYVRRDATPAAAARAAALDMSRSPSFSHPYFWAAFAVTQR
jgi:CHAT domain-containing protein/tetratricopeptide (TPR) repeat protein